MTFAFQVGCQQVVFTVLLFQKETTLMRNDCRNESIIVLFFRLFWSCRTVFFFGPFKLLPHKATVLTCCPSPADDFDELLSDNRTAFLRSVADDLRQRLPLDAMLPSESTAYRTVPRPNQTGPEPGNERGDLSG